MLALYLVSSALARYDTKPLSWPETILRLVLAVLLVTKLEILYISAAVVALVELVRTRRTTALAA